MGVLVAIITLVSVFTFVAIVAWAWSDFRRHPNLAAARIPFETPDEFDSAAAIGTKEHE